MEPYYFILNLFIYFPPTFKRICYNLQQKMKVQNLVGGEGRREWNGGKLY